MADFILAIENGRAVLKVEGSDLLVPLVAQARSAATSAADYRDQSSVNAAQAGLSAATAAGFVGGVLYDTAAAGLAATPANGFFAVVGDTASTYAILYQKVNGAAVEKTRFAGGAAVAGFGSARVTILASLTNGAAEEQARLQAAADAIPNHASIILLGEWLLGAKVEIKNKVGVRIIGLGARVKLAAKAWALGVNRDCGLLFRDCDGVHLEGVSFNCNGAAFRAGGWQGVPAVGAISTATGAFAGNLAPKTCKDVTVDNCSFRDAYTRCIAVRSVVGITIRDCRFRLKSGGGAQFVEIARSDLIRVSGNDFDEYVDTSGIDTYGSHVAISPGICYVDDVQAELCTTPAIHWACIPYYTTKLEGTAPVDQGTWVLSFAGGDDTSPGGYDYSANSWFFTCLDRNGWFDVPSEQIEVVATDNANKTVSLKLRNIDNSGYQNWKGQRFRAYSINTARFCRDVRIEGNSFGSSSGAGVFLLGCKGYVVTGNVARDNNDIGLDAEWSMDGTITGNTILNSREVNMAICVLYFMRNVAVVGNTMNSAPGVDAGIELLANHEVCGNITIANNVIVRGNITFTSLSGKSIVMDGLTIEGNSITMGNGVALFSGGPNGTDKYSLRHVSIRFNRFHRILHSAITLGSAYDVQIEGNSLYTSSYNGFVNLVSSGETYDRINIERNRMSDTYVEWIGIPFVRYSAGGNGPQHPAITFSANFNMDEGIAQTTAGGNQLPMNRPLYGKAGSDTYPAMARGELQFGYNVPQIGAGATLTIGPFTIRGARYGDRVAAWCLEQMDGIMVAARMQPGVEACYVTLTNVTPGAITPGAHNFGLRAELH